MNLTQWFSVQLYWEIIMVLQAGIEVCHILHMAHLLKIIYRPLLLLLQESNRLS